MMLLCKVKRMLLHERLQLGGAEYVLLQKLLHLMEAASRAEHHLRRCLRRGTPGWSSRQLTLGRIRR